MQSYFFGGYKVSLRVGCGYGCVLILLMLYLRQGFPSKHTDIYINSIKQKFEPKSSKRQRTNTEPQNESLSPFIDRIYHKYETIDLQPSIDMGRRCNLPAIERPRQDDERKRWREIEREEYDSIRQEIRVSRSISHPPLHPIRKKDTNFPSNPRSHLSFLHNPSKPQALKEKLMGSCWINHIKSVNKSRREFMQKNSGYLFPEVIAKIPKIAIFQREGDLSLARSLELKSSKEEEIFCSRGQKRSQIKMRAQRIGEAARRRRLLTIAQGGQAQIQPWRQATAISKSLF